MERITVEELLDLAEEFGFSPVENKQWWKLGETGEIRIYVKKAGQRGFASEAHFSDFAVVHPLVRPLSPEEAVAKHLGLVRGVIKATTFKSAPRDEVLRAFRLGLDAMVERAYEQRSTTPTPKVRKASQPAPTSDVDRVEVDDRLLSFAGYGAKEARLLLLGSDLFGSARSGIYSHDDGSRRVVFAPFIGGRTSNETLSTIVDVALK